MIDTSLYDPLTYAINGAAMEVHRELGPGFSEKVYQEALLIALTERKIPAVKEVGFSVTFHGQTVGEFRVDVLVDEAVILELKALESLPKNCEQQLIMYLAASGREMGLLFNFGKASLEHSRYVPPIAIQSNSAYQARRNLWKPAWLNRQKSAQSA
ncbi:MAG TPA: GxxExxY protein [Anaerolineae bacterium]|nr:GxxExxY protein [Anaerolineae bacterium]HQK12942.1 GxxExxY protein [Anaerolineae bacterium]